MNKSLYKHAGLLALLLLFASCGTQKRTTHQAGQQYQVYAVAFYNVENLFDPIDDPNNPRDDEFIPSGPYNWTEAKYQRKLSNIADVFSKLAREHTPYGPAVIGVCEVENRKVLEDLAAQEKVKSMNLQVVHEEGPDWRGIDVALLYNPSIFKLENYNYHVYSELPDRPNYATRNQLLVSGTMGGERVHYIVCHWPSRYGGSASSYLRETAASLTQAIMDSVYQVEPNAKILIMGDLNDDPVDKSVREVLQAKKEKHEVAPQGLYNPTWSLYEQGIGSIAYQDKWNLFDQMMVSHGFLDPTYRSLGFWKTEIFNRPFLILQEGRRKGYPYRTFQDSSFIDGYSDHFPVITYFLKTR